MDDSGKLAPNTIYIYEMDQIWVQFIASDQGLLQELSDYFTFEVENAKWDKRYINKVWDGRIRLADMRLQRIYRGLIPNIKIFCEDRDINLVIENECTPEFVDLGTKDDVKNWIESLDNLKFKPLDYQMDAVLHALSDKRAVLQSPTSSGKSFMIYLMVRYIIDNQLIEDHEKILLTVPTVDLVNQMLEEFKEYDKTYDIEKHVHQIYGGQSKDPTYYTFETEDGNEYTFEGNEFIKLINNSVNKKLAKDITENDEIDDRWLSKLNSK